eukprot:3443710-Pleurochrysis_carterae.AAC.1
MKIRQAEREGDRFIIFFCALAPSSSRAIEMAATSRRLDIEGLRGVAACAVLVYHAAPALLPGGFMGVDIFFVISGYVVTLSLFAHSHNKARTCQTVVPTSTCMHTAHAALFTRLHAVLHNQHRLAAQFIILAVSQNETPIDSGSVDFLDLLATPRLSTATYILLYADRCAKHGCCSD